MRKLDSEDYLGAFAIGCCVLLPVMLFNLGMALLFQYPPLQSIGISIVGGFILSTTTACLLLILAKIGL